MNPIERLPIKITYEGKDYFLRIKPRKSKKKWCIRYIGKKNNKDFCSFAQKQRGYSYTTLYQFFGVTLESTAQRALKYLNTI